MIWAKIRMLILCAAAEDWYQAHRWLDRHIGDDGKPASRGEALATAIDLTMRIRDGERFGIVAEGGESEAVDLNASLALIRS